MLPLPWLRLRRNGGRRPKGIRRPEHTWRLRTRNTKAVVNRGRGVASTASPEKRTAELKLAEKSCLTEIIK